MDGYTGYVSFQIFDLAGRLIDEQYLYVENTSELKAISRPIATGLYMFRVYLPQANYIHSSKEFIYN